MKENVEHVDLQIPQSSRLRNFQKSQNIFNSNPMTFKDPETQKIMPIWEEYYKNLNSKVPEGEIGINPGIMSISKNIDIVHHYGKPSIK